MTNHGRTALKINFLIKCCSTLPFPEVYTTKRHRLRNFLFLQVPATVEMYKLFIKPGESLISSCWQTSINQSNFDSRRIQKTVMFKNRRGGSLRGSFKKRSLLKNRRSGSILFGITANKNIPIKGRCPIGMFWFAQIPKSWPKLITRWPKMRPEWLEKTVKKHPYQTPSLDRDVFVRGNSEKMVQNDYKMDQV